MKTVSLFLLAMCWICGCSSSELSTPQTPVQAQPEPGEPPPYVFVRGEFHDPGRYAWTNGMTMKDAFAAAGGFTDFAWSQINLRHWDGSSERYRWSPERPLTNNPVLKPGDSVLNPRRD